MRPAYPTDWAVSDRLPLRAAVDRMQKCGLAGAEPVRWLGRRETSRTAIDPVGD